MMGKHGRNRGEESGGDVRGFSDSQLARQFSRIRHDVRSGHLDNAARAVVLEIADRWTTLMTTEVY